MERDADVVVVAAGIVGGATAYFLARPGVRVGVVERGPVPGEVAPLPGFLFATGFSGHGFALGPVTGRLVAELIVDGQPSLDLAAFRFSRFAEGAIGKPRTVR